MHAQFLRLFWFLRVTIIFYFLFYICIFYYLKKIILKSVLWKELSKCIRKPVERIYSPTFVAIIFASQTAIIITYIWFRNLNLEAFCVLWILTFSYTNFKWRRCLLHRTTSRSLQSWRRHTAFVSSHLVLLQGSRIKIFVRSWKRDINTRLQRKERVPT